MRKIAPAVVLTTLVAFASGSALAMGDMKKKKTEPVASTTPAPGTESAKTALPTDSTGTPASVGGTDSATVASNTTDKSPKTMGANREKCVNLKPADADYKKFNCASGDGSSGGSGSAGAGSGSGSSSGSSGK